MIYAIALNTFKRSDLIFKDGIKYYEEGIKTNNQTKLLAAEQCFQNEVNFNNEESFPLMAHTKLLLGKYQDCIVYSQKCLEIDYIKEDIAKTAKIYLYMADAYNGLSEKEKMIKYLTKSSNLVNNEAKELLTKCLKHNK